MRAEVISPFRDKFHYNTLYEVGAVVDFDKERIESLIERKLCKPLEGEGKIPSPKVNDKETKKNTKGGRKNVLKDTETPKEEVKKDDETTNGNDELDEKTKSEREAARKIAEATQKTKEK